MNLDITKLTIGRLGRTADSRTVNTLVLRPSFCLSNAVTLTHHSSMIMKAINQKKRASIACVPCRNRKIRCDIVRQAPCTNCRHFSMDCTVYSRNYVTLAFKSFYLCGIFREKGIIELVLITFRSSSHNSRAPNLGLNPFSIEFVLESSGSIYGEASIKAHLSSNHCKNKESSKSVQNIEN